MIQSAGHFSGNTISNCKTGLRVVTLEDTPCVEATNIFDCTTGVLLEKGARGTLRQNDIFDHLTLAITIAAEAHCTLDSNRFSSPNERGAADVSIDSKCLMMNNAIRNQFSPAFQKHLAPARAKEFKRTSAQWQSAVQRAESDVTSSLSTLRGVDDEVVQNSRALNAGCGLAYGTGATASANAADGFAGGLRTRLTTFTAFAEDDDAGPQAPSSAHTRSSTSGMSAASQSGSATPTATPGRRNSSVLVSRVARVKEGRRFSSTVSASAQALLSNHAKETAAGATGPKRHYRVLIHRLSASSAAAIHACRDLGSSLASASTGQSSVVTVVTGPKDHLPSVLRTSSCDAILLVFPPCSDRLTSEDEHQLTAVISFVESKAYLAGMPKKEGGTSAPPPSGKGTAIACCGIVPKVMMGTAESPLLQSAIGAHFLRTYGAAVDDNSSAFLQFVLKSFDDSASSVDASRLLREAYPLPFALPPAPVALAGRRRRNDDGGAQRAVTITTASPSTAPSPPTVDLKPTTTAAKSS